jgi:hypothetical protein
MYAGDEEVLIQLPLFPMNYKNIYIAGCSGEYLKAGEHYIMKIFITCMLHQILL